MIQSTDSNFEHCWFIPAAQRHLKKRVSFSMVLRPLYYPYRSKEDLC